MKICVYCSASESIDDKYKALAYEVGSFIAKKNHTLVYGGGRNSMMGQTAKGCYDHKGHVIGFIPEHLKEKEGIPEHIQELYVVDTMHTRKMGMFDLSDAFLILPGGFGTLDEFFEIITWKQIALHHKPIIIFNAYGYWDNLIHLMHHIIDQQFARPDHRYIFDVVDSLNDLSSVLLKS